MKHDFDKRKHFSVFNCASHHEVVQREMAES